MGVLSTPPLCEGLIPRGSPLEPIPGTCTAVAALLRRSHKQASRSGDDPQPPPSVAVQPLTTSELAGVRDYLLTRPPGRRGLETRISVSIGGGGEGGGC